MKTYTKEELKTILELHLKWLRCEQGGSRADLSSTNLIGTNLIGTNLSRADLSVANLSRAGGA